MTAFEKYLIEAFGETWERSGIMEAHNAALAAQAYQHGLLHAETLKQLAAERRKREALEFQNEASIIKGLREQLAAERSVLQAERKHNESTIVELEQQLAAEREGYAMALQMVHIEGKRANEAEAQRSFELHSALEALRQIATIEANDPDEVAAGLKQTQSYEIATAALAP